MRIKKVKLGKKMRLKYIPFSELINPWHLCFDSNVKYGAHACSYASDTIGSIAKCNSRALKTIKRDDLEALKQSIRKYGLLKPFEVACMGERKYAIIDGQRRYFAIRELLHIGLTEREGGGLASPEEILDYVLIPCLVYDYTEFKDMQRHSIEDNKFSVRPKRDYLETAERMTIEETDIDDYRNSVYPIVQEIREKQRKHRAKEYKREQKEQAKIQKSTLEEQLKEVEKTLSEV